ncbi:hypothetical protein ACWGCW_10190 [Streptomyces sp. NPDC054933]
MVPGSGCAALDPGAQRAQPLDCGDTRLGNCPDVTRARTSGPVDLLAESDGIEILADTNYQGLGAQTRGQVATSRYRKLRNNPPRWFEQNHAAQCTQHPSRRIRVENGIAH